MSLIFEKHMTKIVVTDEYRTNPMSLVPGGTTVEIDKRSGKTLIYDKIKFPQKYVREVYPRVNSETDPIDEIRVGSEVVFSRPQQLDIFGIM